MSEMGLGDNIGIGILKSKHLMVHAIFETVKEREEQVSDLALPCQN